MIDFANTDPSVWSFGTLAFFDMEWVILAMAFIAFVRWIFERVSGAKSLEDAEQDLDASQEDDLQRRREVVLRRQQGGDSDVENEGRQLIDIRRFFEELRGDQGVDDSASTRTNTGQSVAVPAGDSTDFLGPDDRVSTPPPLSSSPSLPDKSADRPQPLEFSYTASLQSPGGIETRARLERLLSSRSGLKDAVVLREVLGPPKSLH
ncbi:MAG: hypothetical protein AAGA96_02410 [Verrucomicrobiota bacterium]